MTHFYVESTMAISNEQIITLQSVKGIGPVALVKICDKVNNLRGGSIDLTDLYDLLESMARGKELVRVSIPDFQEFRRANSVARHIISQSEALGIKIVSRYENTFPSNLLQTVSEDGKPSVPTLLYYKGDLTITEKPALAVIGTREPTPEGERAGYYYAEAFASIGVNIVSGLAVGCDTAGHRGALDAGGATTAFLAHGLDIIYPRENNDLANEIVAKGGLVMSEYPIGTGVNKYNLISRDRLQAGLADATLVIQTGIKGGTMHAVKATQASSKPLFVVEYGMDHGMNTEGNLYLKSKGAQGLRIKRSDIISAPEQYISLIQGRNFENQTRGVFNGTLF